MSGTPRKDGPDDTAAEAEALSIYTVGHSTLSADDFLALLRHYRIERVVDVRAVPRSRYTPQFNKEELSPFLRIRGIKYLHLKELGGLRRHVSEHSPNGGWRNASLRGFADYMLTPAFSSALSRLMLLARGKRTAIMCSEPTPWRCHRSLIADALSVRGVEVVDILSPSEARPHALSPLARVDGLRVTYPPAAEQTDLPFDQ